jgi:hypothetical protein
MGARTTLGVLGLRRSFPACDATFLDVDIVFLLRSASVAFDHKVKTN